MKMIKKTLLEWNFKLTLKLILNLSFVVNPKLIAKGSSLMQWTFYICKMLLLSTASSAYEYGSHYVVLTIFCYTMFGF